jgi:hypothetical protein
MATTSPARARSISASAQRAGEGSSLVGGWTAAQFVSHDRDYLSGRGTMRGAAFILIRSVVSNADDRKEFDHWYETYHLPLVLSKINIVQGWRFWSHSDRSLHYAFVEFSHMESLRQAAGSDDFKFLLADYDRAWGSRGVTRTRDIIEKVQHLGRAVS